MIRILLGMFILEDQQIICIVQLSISLNTQKLFSAHSGVSEKVSHFVSFVKKEKTKTVG